MWNREVLDRIAEMAGGINAPPLAEEAPRANLHRHSLDASEGRLWPLLALRAGTQIPRLD